MDPLKQESSCAAHHMCECLAKELAGLRSLNGKLTKRVAELGAELDAAKASVSHFEELKADNEKIRQIMANHCTEIEH